MGVGYRLLRCGSPPGARFIRGSTGEKHFNCSPYLSVLTDQKERTILYRRYATLHWMCVSAAFSLAAAWIILSAVRHSTASSRCIQNFFSDTSLSSQGQKLCDIFSWVDVGIMGGLWVLLAILQVCYCLQLESPC